MNLKTLFQPKYFYQNLKKSRGIYVLFLFLFPLILALSHGMQTTNGVISFFENNFLGDIMLFIYPITLSFLLFSFVFQKRKVDFMMGMPLSRKQIFVTNTITGILIIITTFIVYSLFIFLLSLFGNSVLSFAFLGNYLLYSILGYIFVFTVSNLAISLSGNFITSLVLTILFILFLPFNSYVYHAYIDSNYSRIVELTAPMITVQPYENCKETFGIKDCEQKRKQGVYYTDLGKATTKIHSIPIQTLVNLNRSTKQISIKNDFKTFLLILLAIFLGSFAFQKRKMEDCEISFRSFHIHSLVKSLTIVPVFFTLFCAEIAFQDIWIIALVLIAYFFLYDLITRKKMSHFVITLGYFFITVLICLGTFQFLKYRMDTKLIGKYSILEKMNLKEIDGFKLNLYNSNELGLAPGYNINSIMFKDKELVKTFLSYAYKLSSDEIDYSEAYFYNLVLKNGTYYTGVLNLSREEKKEFQEKLRNSKELSEYLNIKNSQILTAQISGLNRTYKMSDLNIDIDKVKTILTKKDYKVRNETQDKNITLTIYRNNTLEEVSIPYEKAPMLVSELLGKSNENVIEKLKEEKIKKAVTTGTGTVRTMLSDRKNLEKVVSYIKKHKEIDTTKPYIEIWIIVSGDNHAYSYYTNDLSLLNLFPKVVEE